MEQNQIASTNSAESAKSEKGTGYIAGMAVALIMFAVYAVAQIAIFIIKPPYMMVHNKQPFLRVFYGAFIFGGLIFAFLFFLFMFLGVKKYFRRRYAADAIRLASFSLVIYILINFMGFLILGVGTTIDVGHINDMGELLLDARMPFDQHGGVFGMVIVVFLVALSIVVRNSKGRKVGIFAMVSLMIGTVIFIDYLFTKLIAFATLMIPLKKTLEIASIVCYLIGIVTLEITMLVFFIKKDPSINPYKSNYTKGESVLPQNLGA